MNFLKFQSEHNQEYLIIRDYMEKDKKGKRQIYFLLENESSGEVFSRVVFEDEMNNQFLWEKIKGGDVQFQSVGIEKKKGSVAKLIIETGVLIAEKSTVGKKKQVSFSAKKYRFQM